MRHPLGTVVRDTRSGACARDASANTWTKADPPVRMRVRVRGHVRSFWTRLLRGSR